MRITHIAVNLGAGNESRYRVDYNDINSAGTNQHIHNFECLFPSIGLRYQEGIGVNAEFGSIDRIECMFSINKRRDTARFLHIRYSMQSDSGLTRRFRTINFNHTAAGQSADTESSIQSDSAG